MTRHDESLCDVLHPGKTCIESANDTIDALNRDRASLRVTLGKVAALADDWTRRGEYGDISLTQFGRELSDVLSADPVSLADVREES